MYKVFRYQFKKFDQIKLDDYIISPINHVPSLVYGKFENHIINVYGGIITTHRHLNIYNELLYKEQISANNNIYSKRFIHLNTNMSELKIDAELKEGDYIHDITHQEHCTPGVQVRRRVQSELLMCKGNHECYRITKQIDEFRFFRKSLFGSFENILDVRDKVTTDDFIVLDMKK